MRKPPGERNLVGERAVRRSADTCHATAWCTSVIRARFSVRIPKNMTYLPVCKARSASIRTMAADCAYMCAGKVTSSREVAMLWALGLRALPRPPNYFPNFSLPRAMRNNYLTQHHNTPLLLPFALRLWQFPVLASLDWSPWVCEWHTCSVALRKRLFPAHPCCRRLTR